VARLKRLKKCWGEWCRQENNKQALKPFFIMNELEQLKAFFAEKSILIDELQTYHHLQNDLEFSISLLKLDFRLNDSNEVEFLIFENELTELYENLKRCDTNVIHLTNRMENISFKMMSL
jgi:hypothetical protein